MRGLWLRAGGVEARCNAIYTIEVLGVSCHSNNHSLVISNDGVASLVGSVSLQCCNVLELLKCTWCFCSVETNVVCENMYLCGYLYPLFAMLSLEVIQYQQPCTYGRSFLYRISVLPMNTPRWWMGYSIFPSSSTDARCLGQFVCNALRA